MIVNGKCKLTGTIRLSGAKNSALKLMCASVLLKKGELKLSNIPNLSDTRTMLYLLNYLGTKITLDGDLSSRENGKVVILNNEKLNNFFAPYSIVSKMRATFVILGPLLSRFGEAKVSLPGGCAIGVRGVDIHLNALKEMGADIKIEDGYVIAKALDGKLHGANIKLRIPSVGATENTLMAAILAEGKTIINNAAKEPEIIDLANCLIAMGAKINGVGTGIIEIEGVKELHFAEYTTIGDRIEAGSYMLGALITDGELTITGLDFYNTLGSLIEKLEEIGIDIKKINDNTIKIKRKGKLKPVDIVTDVYPGYPTDLQAQILTLLATIDGESKVDELVFGNRFMHVPELCRMGADISIVANDNSLEGKLITEGRERALIKGKENCYKATQVMASDLRASISLVFAALTSNGKSEIRRIYHLERGYESVMEKLTNCGANIEMIYDGEA
jgi:UDP-N-acetylglucosamine 1-carboxyvinyltransferase